MNIASYIDHTILKPETSFKDIGQLCNEAREAGFKAVCVPPYFIQDAAHLLADSGVLVATVIGFPFGYSTTAAKLTEIEYAITDQADELDMVINLAALKSGDWDLVEDELAACADLIHEQGRTMKLIVESGLLSRDELIRCCELVGRYKIDFIKTATGYAATGATIEAVQIMRAHVPAGTGIKASGGIRTLSFAKALIDAGATRIGCSASMAILAESAQQG